MLFHAGKIDLLGIEACRIGHKAKGDGQMLVRITNEEVVGLKGEFALVVDRAERVGDLLPVDP